MKIFLRILGSLLVLTPLVIIPAALLLTVLSFGNTASGLVWSPVLGVAVLCGRKWGATILVSGVYLWIVVVVATIIKLV